MDTSTATAVTSTRYPLNLSFKKLALAPQISVTDSAGQLVFYVKQKAFKLKEAVTVFADREQTRPLYTINADRVIDFGARYQMSDTGGRPLGSVQRQGMRSIWRTHYEVSVDGRPGLSIREENPWIKVVDGLVGEIPVVGFFTGFLFHPSYLVSRGDGTPVLRLRKQPAFFEGKYSIEQLVGMDPSEETVALLSVLMMTLLERDRG